MNTNAEISRGFNDAIVLNLLINGDSYGYKISKRIIDLTNGKMDIKNATIYLAFKRMEKDGLITSYWSEDEDLAKRKYYKITDKGKKYLKDKKQQWLNNKNILDKLLGSDTNEKKI